MEIVEKKSSEEKMGMAKIQEINRVKYALPSNLNVVERRTNKVSFADQNSYSSQSGNEVVIRLTASTDYVYGKNSYLIMEVQATRSAGTGSIGFLNNNAMSLFERVLYEDRSGAELERNDKLGAYCASVVPIHHSRSSSVVHEALGGQYQNYDRIYDADGLPDPNKRGKNGAVDNYDAVASPLTVIIPLSDFLGIYNQETLVPSMLVSGSLIRLQLAKAGVAFTNLTAATNPVTTVGSYTISNPRIVLDSLTLSPVVQKNLMEQSQAGGGLDFCYETVYYQSGNVSSGQTNFNLQINKAVSRCQKLYWKNRAVGTPEASEKDNLGACKYNIAQLDYRLGDLFFPQRVISIPSGGTPQKNGAEFYENTIQSINRMKTKVDPPAVSKDIWLNSGVILSSDAAANNNEGRAINCQSFEMSSALQYSGLAINNSRQLEARIAFDGGDNPQVQQPATGQVIDAWVCYLKLAKCNQLRAIIKE
jgi:hypothetical protein